MLPMRIQRPNTPLWKIFVATFGFRILLFFIGLAACAVLCGHKTFQSAYSSFTQRWDAWHYIRLAEQGYAGYVEDGKHLFLVFFPGYVWALRAMCLVIPDTAAAGLVLSALCCAGGYCYVYKLTETYYNARVARSALLYLALFPYSFFSGLVMTEGLFLLATAGAVYYAVKRKWLLFAVFGIVSALTRMTGLLVILPAFVELCIAELPGKRNPGRTWKVALRRGVPRLLLLAVPLLGTGGYLLLNYLVDGNPFAFMTMQEHWHQGFMWLPGVLRYVTAYLISSFGTENGWFLWLPTLLLFILSVLILVLSALKRETRNPALWSHAAIYLIVTYSLSWLLSAGRYLSCCFALFILLAKLTEKKPRLRTVILCIEAVCMLVFLGVYAKSGPVL